jgi:hypothetical protein
MGGDSQKLTVQRDLNALAIGTAQEAIQRTGRCLPCVVTTLNPTGFGYSWVTVAFQVNGPYTLQPVTLPKAESQWLRAPTQVGDFGIAVPADTALWGVSGAVAGFVPDTTVDYGNLSALVFLPVGSASFGATPDHTKAWVNGPSGAITSDTAQTATTVHSSNNITHTAGVGTANQVKTIYDGAGNAISHVVSTGGKIGLGALAASLASTRAVPAQADLTSALNGAQGIVGQTLVALMAAVGASIGTSSTSWATAQAQLATIFEAATFVTNIAGINATIPSCSSIVRVAS